MITVNVSAHTKMWLPTDYLQGKKESTSICTLSKLNELVCLELSKNKEKLFSPRLNH